MKLILLSLSLLSATGAAAQSLPGFSPVDTSTTAPSTLTVYGQPMPGERGPWVLGDVVFEGYRQLSVYTLQNRVRARRGILYTPSDLENDVKELKATPGLVTARFELYGMPDQPTPEGYAAIAASTMMARVVFFVEEQALLLPGLAQPATTQAPVEAKGPPVSQSGVVMTPTAYRGMNRLNQPGLGLDVDAAYFIGRLYGKNNLSQKRSNFIDRLGVWFLNVDGKMQLQSETRWRPALSAGARGFLTFRDAPQPSVQTPGVSVQVDNDNTRTLSEGYIVATKDIYGVKSSMGLAQGNAGDRIGLLTEFLSPQFLPFAGHPNGQAKSRTTFFASAMYFPKPNLPLAVELVKPNGMVLNPVLINFKMGYFLKLNFEVSYLKFRGGWDLLGMFAFRYTHFPR